MRREAKQAERAALAAAAEEAASAEANEAAGRFLRKYKPRQHSPHQETRRLWF